MSYIGIDIGGTKIFAARFDSALNIEAKIRIPTEAKKGKDGVFTNIQKALSEVFSDEVEAVGIAWAGLIHPKKGTIVKAPHIHGFDGYALTADIQKQFDVPVFLENDARLFAYAESCIGQGKDLPIVWGITLGTGLGSGIVIHGDILTGQDGFAGEIGHSFMNLSEGKEIEEIFSGNALHASLEEKKISKTLEELATQWQSGSGEGYEFFDPWLDQFSALLVNCILTINPSIIILGGGIGVDIMPIFVSTLEERVKNTLSEKNISCTVNIRTSELENAGALGAALYTKKNLQF